MVNHRLICPVLLLATVMLGCGGRSDYTNEDEANMAGSPGAQCTPGISRECTGAAGCRGQQQCSKDGRWANCSCASGAAAGAPTTALGQGGQPNTFNDLGGATYVSSMGSAAAATTLVTPPPAAGGATALPIASGGNGVGGANVGGIGVGGLALGGTNTGGARGGASSKSSSSAQGGKGGASTSLIGGSSYGGSSYGGSSYGGSIASGAASSKPNSPPVINKLALSPSPARTNDTLSAGVDASDPDGDKISLSYSWMVNGKPSGTDSSRLSGWTYFSKGDSVTVTVVPNDGKAKGIPVTSAAVTIENSPPDLGFSPYIVPSPHAGDDEDLTCQPPYTVSDPDSDMLTTQYQWFRNGVAMPQAGVALLAASTAIGELWSCQMIASDGTTSTKSMLSSETLIVNSVKGIFRTDTTWTAANSPYYLADRVQIAAGVTLTIEPGVTVYAQGYPIESWGNINMAGTKEKPIIIDQMLLIDNSTETAAGKIDLSFVEWDYGGFLASTANATVHVSDCVFESLYQPIYISTPVAISHVFERNVFRSGWGIQSSSPLKLINNVFSDTTDNYAPVVSVSDALTATYNSFLSINKTLVSVGAKNVDVANNYWGGLPDAKIPDHITDNNDDLNIVGAATYLPTLATAHASTPPKDKTYR